MQFICVKKFTGKYCCTLEDRPHSHYYFLHKEPCLMMNVAVFGDDRVFRMEYSTHIYRKHNKALGYSRFPYRTIYTDHTITL